MARKINLDKDGEIKRLAEEFNKMQSEEDLREASEEANAEVLAQKAKADGVLSPRVIVIVFIALAVIIVGVAFWVITRDTSRKVAGLPNVVSENVSTAKKELTTAGFRVLLKYDPRMKATAGTITSQEPPAGEHLNPGDDVLLTVAGAKPGEENNTRSNPPASGTGTNMVTLPNVTGMTRDKAQSTLEALGLKVKEIVVANANAQQNVVLSSNPKPESKVQPGATIELEINSK